MRWFDAAGARNDELLERQSAQHVLGLAFHAGEEYAALFRRIRALTAHKHEGKLGIRRKHRLRSRHGIIMRDDVIFFLAHQRLRNSETPKTRIHIAKNVS